jgi:hypothetical protein
MSQRGASLPHIYTLAAPVCLVAPAVIPIGMNPFVVASEMVLGGLPMSIMALLLANIHAQYRLTDTVNQVAAAVWVVGTLLILTPLSPWTFSWLGASPIFFAQAAATTLATLLFAILAWRAWRLPSRARFVLSIGFGAVAWFFAPLACQRLVQTFVPAYTEGLSGYAQAQSEFFIGAAITGVLLLPAVVGRLFIREAGRDDLSR